MKPKIYHICSEINGGLNYDFLKFVEEAVLDDEKAPVIITINSIGRRLSCRC